MAGTVSSVSSKIDSLISKYELTWVSDAAGAVTGNNNVTLPHGGVVAVTISPGAGALQPTDLYDLTLVCTDHNLDIMYGEGANLSNVNGLHRTMFQVQGTAYTRQWLHGGTYDLRVANAGDSNGGSVDIYVFHGVL